MTLPERAFVPKSELTIGTGRIGRKCNVLDLLNKQITQETDTG